MIRWYFKLVGKDGLFEKLCWFLEKGKDFYIFFMFYVKEILDEYNI